MNLDCRVCRWIGRQSFWLSVGLAFVAGAVFSGYLYYRWNPHLTEDFIFLYLGISAAIAFAVWSTLVLAEREAYRRTMVLPMLSTGLAGLLGFAAAIASHVHSKTFLDVSVSLLAVGLIWTMVQGTYMALCGAGPRDSEGTRRG